MSLPKLEWKLGRNPYGTAALEKKTRVDAGLQKQPLRKRCEGAGDNHRTWAAVGGGSSGGKHGTLNENLTSGQSSIAVIGIMTTIFNTLAKII